MASEAAPSILRLERSMARDLNLRLHLCRYCDHPAVRTWDVDLQTCDHEACKDSAFREVVLRNHYGGHTLFRPRPLHMEPPYEPPAAAA
jgi:hypothetical protein